MANPKIIDINNEFFVFEENIGGTSGNCFYDSLRYLLGNKDDQMNIREKIARYTEEHWGDFEKNVILEHYKFVIRQLNPNAPQTLEQDITDKYNNGSNENKEWLKSNYLQGIKTNKIWADEQQIHAAFNVLDVNIIVYDESNPNAPRTINYPDQTIANKKTIHLGYVRKDHYQPLTNIKTKIANLWLKNSNDDWFKQQATIRLPQTQNKTLNAEELLEYLNNLDVNALKQFYLEIFNHGYLFKKEEKQTTRRQESTFTNYPLLSAGLLDNFFQMFIRFFAILKNFIHKINIATNPGIEFDESETQGIYGEYSEIFSAAGEEGRKLYRSLIPQNLTKAQFLNHLIHKLNHDSLNLFSKIGHQVVSKIEEKILKNYSAEQIAQKVAQNLNQAFKHYYFNNNLVLDEAGQENQTNIIKVATNYVRNLKTKIDDLLKKIPEEETRENKIKIWKSLQKTRLKLVHFVLKIQAFSEGKTLSPEKSFNKSFENYLEQLSKAIPVVNAENPAPITIVQQDNPEKNPKSILPLFTDGNYSKPLTAQADFDKAIADAQTARIKELQEHQQSFRDALITTKYFLRKIPRATKQQLSIFNNPDMGRYKDLEINDQLPIKEYIAIKEKFLELTRTVRALKDLIPTPQAAAASPAPAPA